MSTTHSSSRTVPAHGPGTDRRPPRRGSSGPGRKPRRTHVAAPRPLGVRHEAAQAPPAEPLRQTRSWQRELILVGVLYLAYTASRLASLAPAGAAERNGQGVLDLERTLHIAPEHALNDLLFSAPRWLSVGASYYYQTLHYVITAATMIWLYRSSAGAYRRARTWLVAMTFPALIVFWLFPVAPPRTLPGGVAHDIVAEAHQYGWWGAGGGTAPRGLAGLVNANAAMPSLHVGWAVWVGWNLVHSARNPLVRAFGYVYPLLTASVVISTGNHYLVDVVAGALLAFVAKTLVDRAFRRMARRPTPPTAVDQPRRHRRADLRSQTPGCRRAIPAKRSPSNAIYHLREKR